jgi:predicted kinase
MAKRILIQMAGHGGSGKSTLARQIADRTCGVVIDLDTIKTALLNAGLTWDEASRASYETIHALADDMLATANATVIVDTPSYWAEIHERLTATADRHQAHYVFVECDADDAVRAERLLARATLRSQIRVLGETAADAPEMPTPIHHRPIQRPTGRTVVTVDTNNDVDLAALMIEPPFRFSSIQDFRGE